MIFHYDTDRGHRIEADSVTFEGGGLQFWRNVERVQAPPARILVLALGPGAWSKCWLDD